MTEHFGEWMPISQKKSLRYYVVKPFLTGCGVWGGLLDPDRGPVHGVSLGAQRAVLVAVGAAVVEGEEAEAGQHAWPDRRRHEHKLHPVGAAGFVRRARRQDPLHRDLVGDCLDQPGRHPADQQIPE